MQWKIFVAGVFDLLLLLLYRYLVIQIAHTVEHCHGPSTAHTYCCFISLATIILNYCVQLLWQRQY